MEQRLLRTWYGGEPPAAWQRALAALHGAVRTMYPAERPQRTPAGAPPLIVVGNITVGGTGKTPVVIWLCQQLAALGLRVAVVSRGYGGSHSRGEGTLRVERDTPAAACGDEPLLVHLRTGVPVYVARRRMEAATRAAAGGAQVIIADDGLQHSLLPRDVELAVVDGERGFGNGRLLPAGPLRDPLERLDLVDAIVVNGGPAELPGVPGIARWLPGGAASAAPPVLRMRLEGSTLRSLAEPARTRPLQELAGQRVHAVAALGHPERFFATLAAAGLQVTGHAHRDHAPLPPAALSFGDGLPVLLSEKDAVKCPPTGLPSGLDAWVLPVDATFGGADGRALLGRVLMDARLLELLACPLCKGPLRHVREEGGERLVCRADRLAYPVRDGVPVMLEEEARALPAGDPLLER